jgi:hypothetical protein
MEFIIVAVLFAPIAYWGYRLNKRIHFLKWDIKKQPENVRIADMLEALALSVVGFVWAVFTFFMLMPASVALRFIL